MLTWAVQKYLSDADAIKMIDAVKASGSNIVEVEDLKNIASISDRQSTIFYGSLGLTIPAKLLGKWSPGVVINDNFDYEVWHKHWGSNCLNNGAVFTIEKFCEHQWFAEESHFIRPCLDNKLFTGSVMTYQEFCDWAFAFSIIAPEALQARIVVSKPKKVTEEWRVFMVDGEVSTGSLYQRDNVAKQEPLPQDVIEYAKDVARLWSPAKIFTLDIGRSGGYQEYDESGEPYTDPVGLKVIETGSFNSAGLYGSDATKLVRDINEFYNQIDLES